MPDDAKDEATTPTATRTSTGRGYGALFWFTGWLFTIGYASLAWWQGLLALLVWPLFLGLALR